MTRRMLVMVGVAVLVATAGAAKSQEKKAVTLREVLLSELRTTHTEKDWFVPANVAVQGLTAEQANWQDGKGNHSVGQLAYHLLFWNRRTLRQLKGEPEEKFSGNNDETFDKFDAKKWQDTVKGLDAVMTDIEKFVETADEAKLQKNAHLFTKISTHNAYHVGQIIYVRKEQGSWDANNGVK